MSKSLRHQDKTSIQIFITIWVTVGTLLTLLPIYITLIKSIKGDYAIKASIFSFPDLLNAEFAKVLSENYSKAWTGMSASFFRSVALAFVGAFLTCVIGTILGYIFTYKHFHFKEGLFMVFLAVMMLPSIMGMPILVPFMSRTLGLKDTYVGYMLPILSGGQVTSLFLFRTFFGQQPKSIYESARIEGASDIDIYFMLTVPLALPIILYCFVGSVSSQYNDYLWPTLILDKKMTLMPMMKKMQETFTYNGLEGAIYAMYILSSIPLIITSSISMKFFSGGDFAAGMKL